MRHQTRLIGERLDEILVRLDAIDRGKPQPFEIWRRAQDCLDEPPERGSVAKIGAIRSEIDAGQDNLAKALFRQAPRRADHFDRAAPTATGRVRKE